MPPGVELVGSEAKKAPRRGWKHRLRPPSPSLNVNRSRLLQLVQHASANGPVLDLGSGARRLGERVINFDLDLFVNVDVIGSAGALPFVDAGFDLVICQAVLEHVRDPHGVVAEIGRVLSGSGCVYAEIPFLQGYHADPHDYQRYTQAGIEALFGDFAAIETGVCVGPASALGWVLIELAALLVPTQLAKKGVRFTVGWLAAAMKQCDRVLARRPDAHRIAAGLFFLGRKKGGPGIGPGPAVCSDTAS